MKFVKLGYENLYYENDLNHEIPLSDKLIHLNEASDVHLRASDALKQRPSINRRHLKLKQILRDKYFSYHKILITVP